MKKINLLFTALLLMCCVGTAKAVEVTIDGIKYDVITKAKQATVISGGNYSGNIVIPIKITYNNATYSVTSIRDVAFYGCSGLTSITIPNSVTSIGEQAFYGCSGLTSITIPNSVTSIEYSAFSYCSGIESIVVDPGNTKYDSRENCNAIIETESNTLITGCKKTVIPNSVTSIESSAFSGCSGLTSITIPNNVTSIGNHAFYYCDGLTSITIPNSVTSIGSSAFRGCSRLTSITIPNNVTSIGEEAFANCSGLTSITIPNSVKSIGNSAFDGCSGLTSITIPNSVTSIGNYAFSSCSGLTSITIPNSVTSIGWGAFGNCENLGDVYCFATNVPATRYDWGDYYNPFEGSYPEYMTLHVPVASINNYKTTYPWSEFGNIVEITNTGIINIPANAVLVTSSNGTININCSLEGEVVELYTSDAMYIGSTTIENGTATIESGLSKGDIAIIKIAEKSIKVILN